MTMVRICTAVWVVALGLAAVPASAQTSDDFFNQQALQKVELWMHSADWDKLKQNFQDNTYYPADMTWNGITVYNIGIRSRGLGSRSSTKPGLRVDFDRYMDGQHFLGLKSYVLDNLTQDKSGIRETTIMHFFTRLGIPAPRETHTRLYVNGNYVGLYGLVESVDKTMMGRVFGSIGDDVQNDGYLFEYKYLLGNPWRFTYEGADLTPYKARFEIKTNESHTDAKIWGPIEELARLVNNTDDASFDQVISQRLDIAAFVRYISAQNFVAQNDGFNGYDGMNNFYFYRLEQSPKHVFLAWDEDVGFLQPDFDITTRLNDNVLTRKSLALSTYQSQYFSVLLESADSASGWMRDEMQRQFDMVNDAMLEDTQKPYSNAEYQGDREFLLAFPDARISYVRCEVAKVSGSARPAGCQ
jgi:spore coat protein CotH